MSIRYWASLLAATAALLARGATTTGSAGSPFATPTNLTATLVDPIDIDLRWVDNASNEAGYVVEYSPDANQEFVIIDVLPPNSTYYRHPRLLPHTRFVYRVRPIFGGASNVAEFKTGSAGPPQQTGEPSPQTEIAAKYSLRSAATLTAAAPTDLHVELLPPAGVKMRWRDHASDADGYVFELKPEWASDFKVSGFLKAGATSLVSYGFPFDTKFQVRVRAFVYGQPSNLAEQTTGADPTLPTAADVVAPHG